jgi:hypothetical protein
MPNSSPMVTLTTPKILLRTTMGTGKSRVLRSLTILHWTCFL